MIYLLKISLHQCKVKSRCAVYVYLYCDSQQQDVCAAQLALVTQLL